MAVLNFFVTGFKQKVLEGGLSPLFTREKPQKETLIEILKF